MQPVVLPPGSDAIAAWARGHRLPYQPAPEPSWYRAWEPFDTIVAPGRYYNAVEIAVAGGRAIVVEPWASLDDTPPLDRTIVAFVTHPELHHRASAKVGDTFLTRVAYVGQTPPRQQTTGDVEWDHVAVTYAATPLEAVRAITPSLRKLLLGWGFAGHLEIREGAMLFHLADARPTPADYDRVARWIPAVIEKARKTRG